MSLERFIILYILASLGVMAIGVAIRWAIFVVNV